MTTRKTSPLGWKGLLSIGFISASVIYAIAQHWGGGSTTLATTQNGTGTPAPTTKPTNLNLPTKSTTASAASAPSTTSAKTSSSAAQPTQSAPQNTGKYKDGTYKGPAENDYYGTVQVEAVVSGGKLADVKFLQYPNEHRTSVFINQQAMPMLTREAVQAQSANVNGVSGATFTSEGFVRSLASALSSAKA